MLTLNLGVSCDRDLLDKCVARASTPPPVSDLERSSSACLLQGFVRPTHDSFLYGFCPEMFLEHFSLMKNHLGDFAFWKLIDNFSNCSDKLSKFSVRCSKQGKEAGQQMHCVAWMQTAISWASANRRSEPVEDATPFLLRFLLQEIIFAHCPCQPRRPASPDPSQLWITSVTWRTPVICSPL